MKRLHVPALATVTFTILACTAVTSQPGNESASTAASSGIEPVRSQQTEGDNRRGGENLQILPADIPRRDLIATMRRFSRSLGVKCDFCHVPEGESFDFPSDANPHKDIARLMMRMTRDINQRHIAQVSQEPEDQVTCYTCHRGEKEPKNVLPPLPERK